MTEEGGIGLDPWRPDPPGHLRPSGPGPPLEADTASYDPQVMSLYSVPSYLDIIEQAISEGDILLIENIGETVDPVLDPLLGRNTIKKGR